MTRRGLRTDPYSTIEGRWGFAVPSLYRRMQADGRLQYGRTRAEWRATWKERALTDPPALLGADFEWLSLKDIAAWRAPDYWRPTPALVPFAQNGASDVWAWVPEWTARGRTPIVFAYHDENEAKLFAPDLEGLLFRVSLEYFTDVPQAPDPGDDDLNPDERVISLRAQIAAIAPYVPPRARRILREVVTRPLRTALLTRPFPGYRGHPYRVCRLLGDREARRLVREVLAWSRLDETFQHMEL